MSSPPPSSPRSDEERQELLDHVREAYQNLRSDAAQLDASSARIFTGIAFITTGILAFGLREQVLLIRYEIGDGGLPLPAYAFLAFVLSVAVGVFFMLMSTTSARYLGDSTPETYGRYLDFLDIAASPLESHAKLWTERPATSDRALTQDYLSANHHLAIQLEYRDSRISEARAAFTLAFVWMTLGLCWSINALVRQRTSGEAVSIDSISSVPWDGWGRSIALACSTGFGILIAYERYRFRQNIDALFADRYWNSWRRFRRARYIAFAIPLIQIGLLFGGLGWAFQITLCLAGVTLAEVAFWQRRGTAWQHLLVGLGAAAFTACAIAVFLDHEQLSLLVSLSVLLLLELPAFAYSSVRWITFRRDRRREQARAAKESSLQTDDVFGRFLNIAHQGGAREAPSNTIYAIRKALNGGANAIDVDVCSTSDGEVVAIHDLTLDRTTNLKGRVASHTTEEVRQADAAYWWIPGTVDDHSGDPAKYTLRGQAPENRSLGVPTLQEVLETVPADVPLSIEVKDGLSAERVVSLLDRSGRRNSVIVGSFRDRVVRQIRSLDPTIPTSPGRVATAALVLGARLRIPLRKRKSKHTAISIPPSYSLLGVRIQVLTDRVARAVKAREMLIFVWTIDDAETVQRLIDQGVDGIFTDVPTVVAEALKTQD